MTQPTYAHHFIWLDLETTGPDERYGEILEFAAVLAQDAPGDNMSIVDIFSAVRHFPESRWGELDPYVKGMHLKNGLLRECAASDNTLDDFDECLWGLCAKLTGTDAPRGIQLAGNSVHFDLRWCKQHLPKFSACLHHRVFDVSTVLTYAQLYTAMLAPPLRRAHRALDDILESVELLRFIRRHTAREN